MTTAAAARTAAQPFGMLFSPLRLRNLDIRNRILSTGHQTFLAKDGVPGEDLIAYHTARARGGAGLIIVESARFHASAFTDYPELLVTEDRSIPAFRALADAVHAQGARIFGQLSHAGRVSKRMRGGLRDVAFAPSAVPDHRFHTMPRAMPTEMVEELVEAVGSAAGRLAEAGLDGVEILASHGLLFAQFLNPRTNLREDRYGGSAENRLRFVAESLAAMRHAVGDRLVGMRISAEELEPEGLEIAEVIAACTMLAERGLLDYLNVTVGSMAGQGGSVHVVPPMAIPTAYIAPQAGRLRAATGLPILVAGRINQPQIAEAVLLAGQADMIGMTRALIADPDLPRKAQAGRLDDIRACIACNQACIGHFHAGYGISCIQNPVTGREARLPPLPRVAAPRTVLVAGGGPAGMKAAVTAAERGHRVILCEAGSRLGGQALLAQMLSGRAEFGGLITNLEQELSRAGVEIRLNTRVDRALVETTAPDAVIVATGARPYEPVIEGREDAHVVGAWAVLQGHANTGARVLVADWRADWVGMGLAEKLVLDGHHVTLAVDAPHAGFNLQLYLRSQWAGRLHRLGVEVVPDARLNGVDGTTAYLLHATSGEAMIREAVDTVVLATGHASETALEQALIGLDCPVHLAGDCLAPRSAEEAVHEGFMAGRTV